LYHSHISKPQHKPRQPIYRKLKSEFEIRRNEIPRNGTRGNEIRENVTRENVTRENEIRENVTGENEIWENEIRGNVARVNETRGNVTRKNKIRGSMTRGNEIWGNVNREKEIRGNETRGNEIRGNVTRGKVISAKRSSEIFDSGKRVYGELSFRRNGLRGNGPRRITGNHAIPIFINHNTNQDNPSTEKIKLSIFF
jgi:hypothetical protein